MMMTAVVVPRRKFLWLLSGEVEQCPFARLGSGSLQRAAQVATLAPLLIGEEVLMKITGARMLSSCWPRW